ncbi:MAG: ATP-binding cassette domain-containing protein [Calditrichota bacterium]
MIEFKHLSKKFGALHILKDINLAVNDQEILTIIGQSGAGKTVLLKTLLGLIPADQGEIHLDGKNIIAYNESQLNKYVRSNMSIVFQQGALWDSMTVRENIDLALRVRLHLSEAERTQRIDECLDMVDLSHAADVYPDELSGGMMKRVAIARAIAPRPKYLLYDEPTTGLDPVLSNTISDLILGLTRELSSTTLIISHDIENIRKISDRVAMLYEGKIILTCSTEEMWNVDMPVFKSFIRGESMKS